MHQRCSSLTRNRPLRSQLEPSCLSVSSLAFFLSSLVPMAQKRARPTSSVEGFDGRDDAPEEEERVFFDDDNAEHTMSDLPVLMEIAWPSLTEGCGKRPCGALFSSCRWSCFFSLPSCWLVILGARVWNGDALYVRLGQPSAIPY